MIDQTLVPYRILDKLGEDGMGEVYCARDTRLAREVAIKVLPADHLKDEHRRRGFLQEARTLSSLNHPHNVTIYEIESADDTDFIVMELVARHPPRRADPAAGLAGPRSAADCDSDRRCPRRRARPRHRPSRPQAGEHHRARRWHGEGARLRPRQVDGHRAAATRDRDRSWHRREDELVWRLEGINYGDLFWGPRFSPDRTTMVYGKVTHEGEDLMMIENFR